MIILLINKSLAGSVGTKNTGLLSKIGQTKNQQEVYLLLHYAYFQEKPR